jgi:hypothetical protein
MNIAVSELANLFFKKSLHECSRDELKQLVQHYPYFAPAQLLWAKKLQEDNSSLYAEQVQRTSLYFQNRMWLNHLLEKTPGINETVIPAAAEEIPTLQTDETNDADRAKEEEVAASPGLVSTVFDKEESIAGSTTEDVMVRTDQPAESTITQSPVEDAPGPVFEPYHAVDYFASQGIRYKEEDKPKDKFSQQLKSFTEWLKTMKRVPGTEGQTTSDVNSEGKVEQLAEHSLVERHVVTEAMAEVWIKQGNTAKAEDIYRKLSLLDPSKTAYFAAKIEGLKKTS